MLEQILHLSHCTYINGDFNYEWNERIDEYFHSLPNCYAITVVQNKDVGRDALSTILVKTNLGQSEKEIEKIYSSVISSFSILKNLPVIDVTLVSTKLNFKAEIIPSKDDLMDIMADMYTQNAVGGNA
jgi:hypothetical protein